MPSERVRRRIDQLLDDADQAIASGDWETARLRCQAVIAFDPDNSEVREYLVAIERGTGAVVSVTLAPAPLPATFGGGRYRVTSLLGEGGKKVVYQAHDTLLDRDVAFALLKTDGLDAASRERVKREAQALGRLGSHPNIASVFDLGEENGRPYIVTELLPGGDLAALIAGASDHRLPLGRVLELAQAISKALAFAHGKGVIHRDLKPGNIWLAEDGTPKLGDFGLAMAGDDPRLTRAGMIVGTALYMAPEQATGGEVTARSDLYSLGCLLFELVCGRPPFPGDDSVAIIGQHLSSVPVAPSWYRPDCPRALEGLVLRLLEKDPSKRPAAAHEVAEQLAAINPAAPRTTSESQQAVTAPSRGAPSLGGQGTQSPVYRRTFVGRETELQQLEAAFDAAAGGQGRLVMLCGEPGVGKTALTEQVATYTGLRGGRVLVGHCYEEGSLSLPYLPFVEALRGYVLSARADSLRQVLGGAASEVARIVSEVRERVGVEPAAASGDPIGDRYRLLQGVSDALHGIAEAQPLVLVLEDLHDADRGTLDLLQFLARQLQGARLLLVGTYRDVEVDRQHPLSATLAELRRGTRFSRLLLRGLTTEEVQRMVAAIAGQDVTRRLAEAVHRQTEGNPLFVQEVVRYLADAGLIERKDGRWQATSVETLLTSIPEGLRDVIGKRLSRLSPRCNQVLAAAAVIGREFELATLQAIAGLPEEELLTVLEEAVKVAVLQDSSRGGQLRYRFTHAFFRQTLYEELIAPRRIRMHQQVARALEAQYAHRLDEHAAELAEHFGYSSDPAELAKAVEYGERAAARASAVHAHGESVRLLEQALQVQELADPEGAAMRQQLLMALGQALIPAGQPLRAADEVFPEAFRLAESLGDRRGAFAAARWVLASSFGAPRYGSPQWREWTARVDRYAEPGTLDRLWADYFLSYNWDGHAAEARAARGKALEQADRLDVPDMYFRMAFGALYHGTPAERAEQRPWVERLIRRSREGVRPLSQVLALFRAATYLLAAGDRPRAEATWHDVVEIESAARARDVSVRWCDAYRDLILAAVDGRLDEALAAGQQVFTAAAEMGVAGGDWGLATALHNRVLLYAGRTEEALTAADRPNALTHLQWAAERVWAWALAGRCEEARAEIRRLLAPRSDDSGTHVPSTFELGFLLEAAITCGDAELAAQLAADVAPVAGFSLFFPEVMTCPARLLGQVALLTGDRERARELYLQALTNAAKIRCRPEVALTHLHLGELFAASPPEEQVHAGEHLNVAIAEFKAMGMRPALERALALRERLGGGPTAPAVPAAQDAGAVVPALAAEPASAPVLPAEPEAAPQLRQVFISYGSHDLQRALALEALLKAEGLLVWLDKRSIPPGSSWDAEIVKGIRNSAVIAVLCSPEAVQSPHVQQELRLAMEMRKPLLPLILRPTAYPDAVKYILTGQQWIELLERREAEWFGDVLAAVRRLAGEAR